MNKMRNVLISLGAGLAITSIYASVFMLSGAARPAEASSLFCEDCRYVKTLVVDDFGAVPDDGLDDTAAINAAIEAAPEAHYVAFSSGTYHITSAILLKDNVWLKSLWSAFPATIVYDGAYGDAMILADGRSHFTVSHLILDANHNPQALQGIVVNGGTDNMFLNNTIKNFVATTEWGPHAILMGGVTNSAVAYNTIQNIAPTDEWGTGIKLAWGSSNNQIVMNNISNTGRGGILCESSSDNTIRDYNQVSGSGLGLSVELWDCDRANVTGNVLDCSISVAESDNIITEPNTITGQCTSTGSP